MAHYGLTETMIGSLLVAVDGDALIGVKFDVDERALPDALEELRAELHGAYELTRDDRKIEPAARQIRDYVAGKRAGFDLRFDLSWMTPFRRQVLEECARIPRGQVASYGELARRVGRPRASRAVGNTMRTNPLPIVIPCHRVVGSDGRLTGFGGGLGLKQRLLELEGALAPA